VNLTRRTPLARAGRLRARSKRRARLYRQERVPLVAELLADQPPCERCHQAWATDVHEIKSRARGGSILDVANLALLCRTCHEWVTTNPTAARAEGWLLNSWDPTPEGT
jgi:5-methylcytosine-specific restriction endonuclease McrA